MRPVWAVELNVRRLIRTAGVAITLVTILMGSGVRTASAQAYPYYGRPVDVPGIIQAEDFDFGGEGVSYYDTTPGNSGRAYREGDVDIEPCSAGGYDVGWTDVGEWMNYTVNVTTSGSYVVQLQVASMNGGVLHVGFNGPSSGVWSAVSIPGTGGWQTWTTVSVAVNLNAGVQQMTILFDTGGTNLDSVTVTGGAGSGDEEGRGSQSGGTTADPVVVTWNIDSIEPGNGGWDHAARTIDYIANMSPQPQIVIFQEALLSQFNTYIGELQARTGQNWNGVFATHCAPGAWSGWCSNSQDEGVGVFTSLPLVDSSTTYLPFPDDWHSARAVARAAIVIGDRTVQVFGAHMSNTPDARYNMMQSLVSYTQHFSSPQLVAGDFNADPDQIDQWWAMGSAFRDAWSVVGSGPGYTALTPDATMHLDYWFTDLSGMIQPQWAAVVTDSGSFSDHFRVLAAFVVQ